MSLLDRLIGTQVDPALEPKIAVHQFMAALAEYKRGAVTGAQMTAAFDLSSTEQTQLSIWFSNLDSDQIDRTLIHDVLLLGEAGHYPKSLVQSRLGVGE